MFKMMQSVLIGVFLVSASACISAGDASGEAPRFTGTKRIGARPGHPIQHFVSAVPAENLKLKISNLPEGLSFNAKTQVLTGKIEKPGTYVLEVTATNGAGKTTRPLTLEIGEKILLTPPMGWNSWYCYSESVSDTAIRTIAQGMKSRGLINYGWQYVNIDDCWQSERGGKLNAIQPNDRFPDMKKMCDDIHAMGLKVGIYSTPWVSTYAGFIGGSDDNGAEKEQYLPLEKRKQKYQVFGGWPGLHRRKMDHTGTRWFFDNDVKQWAEWGFDYVKVDWKPNDVPTTKRISDAIRNSGRDIVLSLSNAAPHKSRHELAKYAQLWRTTGDIHDAWGSISGIGFNQNNNWADAQKPGAFNDPDMLQVGAIGTPNTINLKFRPSRLTYEEQRTQVSLWSLMASPLMVSCDIVGMDDSTFALLTNVDLIDIHQDVLVVQAKKQKTDCKDIVYYVKPLEDKTHAVGFFNLSKDAQTYPCPYDNAEEIWSKRIYKKGELIQLPTHGCAVFKGIQNPEIAK